MIVAIAGGTGSGKTTIAKRMAGQNENLYGLNTMIISMDNYYKNCHLEPFDNYDHPDAFDIDLLRYDLADFLSNRKVTKRHYCYQSKERHATETRLDIDMVILEGLYAFYDPALRAMCNLKIYLDIDEETRLKRRIRRDMHERGITPDENRQMIDGFVKSMHALYVSRQKLYADRSYRNNEAVDTPCLAA